jgi:hypothetical protein
VIANGTRVSFKRSKNVLKLDCDEWLHNSVNILKAI